MTAAYYYTEVSKKFPPTTNTTTKRTATVLEFDPAPAEVNARNWLKQFFREPMPYRNNDSTLHRARRLHAQVEPSEQVGSADRIHELLKEWGVDGDDNAPVRDVLLSATRIPPNLENLADVVHTLKHMRKELLGTQSEAPPTVLTGMFASLLGLRFAASAGSSFMSIMKKPLPHPLHEDFAPEADRSYVSNVLQYWAEQTTLSVPDYSSEVRDRRLRILTQTQKDTQAWYTQHIFSRPAILARDCKFLAVGVSKLIPFLPRCAPTFTGWVLNCRALRSDPILLIEGKAVLQLKHLRKNTYERWRLPDTALDCTDKKKGTDTTTATNATTATQGCKWCAVLSTNTPDTCVAEYDSTKYAQWMQAWKADGMKAPPPKPFSDCIATGSELASPEFHAMLRDNESSKVEGEGGAAGAAGAASVESKAAGDDGSTVPRVHHGYVDLRHVCALLPIPIEVRDDSGLRVGDATSSPLSHPTTSSPANPGKRRA